MIGVARENPQTYAAGAMLANGARLAEIHARYVTLERGGRSVRLYLSGSDEDKAERRELGDLGTVGGPQTVPAAVATSYEAFTDYIRPNPVFDGDRIRGYEVYPGKIPGPFSRMGLVPGDVIQSIDGIPLTDPVQSVEAFRGLTDGAEHVASVSRKSGSSEVSLDGAFIVEDIEHRKEAMAGGPTPAPFAPPH
jgi:type II secretion system protein C